MWLTPNAVLLTQTPLSLNVRCSHEASTYYPSCDAAQGFRLMAAAEVTEAVHLVQLLTRSPPHASVATGALRSNPELFGS